MAAYQIKIHEVEFLSVANGKVGDPPNERPVTVITIRPDEGSFRPHNIGIPRHQAERLLADLQCLLKPTSSDAE